MPQVSEPMEHACLNTLNGACVSGQRGCCRASPPLPFAASTYRVLAQTMVSLVGDGDGGFRGPLQLRLEKATEVAIPSASDQGCANEALQPLAGIA